MEHKKHRGSRGFIIKYLPSTKEIELSKNSKDYNFWPSKKTENSNSTWYSAIQEFGLQPLFGKVEGWHDPESLKNSCFNMLPDFICGKKRSTIVNHHRIEIIHRGSEKLYYFPQSEIHFRRQYAIAMEVWNYDLFWQN